MEISVPGAAACALFNTVEETNTSIELVMSNKEAAGVRSGKEPFSLEI